MTWPSSNSVNAWMYLQEDDPSGTIYSDGTSSFQSAVRSGVYKSVDWLGVGFFHTAPAKQGWTLEWPEVTHTSKVSGKTMTNAQYLSSLTADARAANPNILLVATLLWGNGDTLNNIFTGPEPASGYAAQFAANLVEYLNAHDLDGLDIDWEYPLSSDTTAANFNALLPAIRAAFDQQKANGGKPLYLTLSPASTDELSGANVNPNIDLVNLQIYGGAYPPSYTELGIDATLLAYGAKFESIGPGAPEPDQTAQEAYEAYQRGSSNGVPFRGITNWRINSGNFAYEQAQQIILYQLVNPAPPNASFDDTTLIATAENPPISSLTIRAGDVLDAIQTVNTGSFESAKVTYTSVQHGGSSGVPHEVSLAPGELLTEVSGYTGTWYGWECVVQLTLKTSRGRTFGPFGSMAGATDSKPFSHSRAGQCIVAFSGSTVLVPLASGKETAIIANLGVSYAAT